MAKILLQFPEERIDQPITSQIILELKVPLNILNANIAPHGGEILVEVPSKDVDVVVQAFKKKGVIVTIQRGIEVNEEKCTDCGACYSICPVDAISIKKDYSVIFDEEKCIFCSFCVDACPTRAIKV